MTQEPDRELKEWLAEYRVEEIDAVSRDALLDKIVAHASASQPRSGKVFSLRFLNSFAGGWLNEAAALAAAAVFGFWIGSGSSLSSSETVMTSEVASSSVSTYLGETVFGPTSWKEVSL